MEPSEHMCSSAVEWIPKDIPAGGLREGEVVGQKCEHLWDWVLLFVVCC